ncbi:exodeoxyribonuclease-like isoform X2 [Rhopilema esculentum]|uniref:exodeoxyribonuclease-like isoform X2 n=1 Tax=Rhopilema esculentum TaxID=499914 RepID=UPI0031DC15FB|eukprot:gene17266-8830_t
MPKRKQTSQEGNEVSPKKKSQEGKPEEKQTANKTSDVKLDELNTKTNDGRSYNVKIVSWNCAGLRAMVKKNGLDYLKKEDADIVCLQETKCTENECPPEVNALKGGGLSFAKKSNLQYNMYLLPAEKKGYSGTALWTKKKPLKVTYGLGIDKHDKEGRLITAEYEKFYLVTSYVPNSGRGLVNLEYRMGWEKDMKTYLKKLEETKPVIFCGDLNVAHNEIDIANPKSNVKNPGFTKEEREKFTDLLEVGFVDSYRHLNPDKTGTYTFWSYMGNARDKNIGWRLDYFVLSKSLLGDLCDSSTRSSVTGSDHCPIVLLMAL